MHNHPTSLGKRERQGDYLSPLFLSSPVVWRIGDKNAFCLAKLLDSVGTEFAMAVAAGLHATKGQVNLCACGRRIQKLTLHYITVYLPLIKDNRTRKTANDGQSLSLAVLCVRFYPIDFTPSLRLVLDRV